MAWAVRDPLQHGAHNRGRTNHSILQQIAMRQVPGTRQMPAASPVAHVLSRELRARAGVEHMRVAVELPLEGLPIDQTNGPSAGDRAEAALRGRGTRRQPSR
jgi:hypothetical protein